MDTIRCIIGWLVVIVGLFGWIAFIPQIRLLIKVKEAKDISAGTIWMSFGMQIILFSHILLQPKHDLKLSSVYIMSLTGCVIILSLIYYYRRWPGGRIGK